MSSTQCDSSAAFLAKGRAHKPAEQRVWAVRAWEPAPPAGVEPVDWLLLTNVPAGSEEQAWERVEQYACRMVVENVQPDCTSSSVLYWTGAAAYGECVRAA